jgi:serine phosphatase RsbU (regulator of sigma subunit)
VVDEVYRAISAFARREDHEDDVTVLVLRFQ